MCYIFQQIFKFTNQNRQANKPFMGSVRSLPVNTGLGITGVGILGGVVFSLGFGAGVEGATDAGGGGQISWNGAGGKMAPVCLAMKFRMSSLRMRPSFPVPTTSLSLICEDFETEILYFVTEKRHKNPAPYLWP